MKVPTQLTVLRIVLAPLFYAFFIVSPPNYLLAAVIFILASVTDWYDGYYARKMKLVTRFGTFLDPLADKILTSVAFIAFASIGIIPFWTAIIVIFRDIFMTVFRLVADINGLPVKTSFAAKVKTFFQMVYISAVLLVLVASQGTLGESVQEFGHSTLSTSIFYWGMLLVVGITVVTFVQYLFDNAALVRISFSKYILRRNTQHS